MAARQARGDRRHRGARRGREPVGDDPGRERQDRGRRLAHRRGAQRRLARRLPRPARGGRGPARPQGRDAAGHAEAGRLGRRGGRALRPRPAGLIGRRGDARPGCGPPPEGQPGHHAPGRAGRERRRPGHDGRGRAARDRGLPGAAHRAGPAPGGGRQARRGRDRLLRRRAPQHHVHRQGQPRGLDADEPAQGRVPGRGPLRPGGAGERDRARRRGHDRHRHRRARHPHDHQPALRGDARPARVQARAAAGHARRREGGRRPRSPKRTASRSSGSRSGRSTRSRSTRTARRPRRAGRRRDHRRRGPAAAAVRRAARRAPRSRAATRP